MKPDNNPNTIFMNDIFTISINNEPLEVRKLKFKNYLGAYEIRKNSAIQFILVHNENSNKAWNVDYAESSQVSSEYMDKIITAINYYYS
jgi:hypothetical protein